MIAFSVVWFIVVLPHSVGLWNWSTTMFCVRFNSPSTMLKSHSYNPLGTTNTTFCQETSNLYHILEPIIGNLFLKITFGRSLRSGFIDPFSFAKETLQHFARFWRLFFFQSCDGLFFLFFFFLVLFPLSFLIFMVTSDWVLNQLQFFFKFQRKRNELRHPGKNFYLQLTTHAWTGARGPQIWCLEKWIFTSTERKLHVSIPYEFLTPFNSRNPAVLLGNRRFSWWEIAWPPTLLKKSFFLKTWLV